MQLCLLSKFLTKFNPDLLAFKHVSILTFVFEIFHFKIYDISLPTVKSIVHKRSQEGPRGPGSTPNQNAINDKNMTKYYCLFGFIFF